ncbi:hypothetical protein PENSPDRAFT_50013 [Peniophora sp. CONT]|nr:hypothetical protein PENSPDRAFT_50013 [Peniophora sp. CONT]
MPERSMSNLNRWPIVFVERVRLHKSYSMKSIDGNKYKYTSNLHTKYFLSNTWCPISTPALHHTIYPVHPFKVITLASHRPSRRLRGRHLRGLLLRGGPLLVSLYVPPARVGGQHAAAPWPPAQLLLLRSCVYAEDVGVASLHGGTFALASFWPEARLAGLGTHDIQNRVLSGGVQQRRGPRTLPFARAILGKGNTPLGRRRARRFHCRSGARRCYSPRAARVGTSREGGAG